LKIIRQKEIDIIITDLKMPQMDGIELIRELSKNSFDGVVLVLSNYTDFELVREALTAGALDYIIKVNLDSAILQQQLAKAANKLDSLRQNKKQEIEKGRLIEKSKRIMQNDQMMKLFNNPDLTQNDLEILDNITTCEKDCLIWIIDVYLKPGSNEKKAG
jgi:YesN/AraC family two-component response regulator